jgi:hypothetical protein
VFDIIKLGEKKKKKKKKKKTPNSLEVWNFKGGAFFC